MERIRQGLDYTRDMRVIFLLLLSMVALAAEWSPSLSMKLKTIAEVLPSPDGKSVIWLETKAVIDK